MPELLVFVFGLVAGSFLNILISRLPRQTPLFAPLRCDECGAAVERTALIPVIGYYLGRRCLGCGAARSDRILFLEILTGLLFVACLLAFGLRPELAKALLLTAFLLVIAVIDYDYQLIFDKVLLWLAGSGLIVNLLIKYAAGGWNGLLQSLRADLPDMIIAVLAGGGIMLVLALISRGGLGGGDIKLAAALGLWLGWKLTLLTLLLSFLLGGVCGAVLLLLKIKGRKDLIPFGPFITLGAYIAMLYGKAILFWYFRAL